MQELLFSYISKNWHTWITMIIIHNKSFKQHKAQQMQQALSRAISAQSNERKWHKREKQIGREKQVRKNSTEPISYEQIPKQS